MSAEQIDYHPKSSSKLIFFLVFGLLTIFVTYMKNQGFFDPTSPTAQRYAPAFAVLLIHGFSGVIALLLGAFQLSNRLRARYLKAHRVLGYIYVLSVFVAAPFSVLLAMKINSLSLVVAASVQSLGWMLATAIALYCVRNGNVVQHRRWMIRSYFFAMVFTVVRLIVPIPPIMALGETGVEIVVWSTIVVAAFVPSILLDWRNIISRPTAKQTMTTALGNR